MKLLFTMLAVVLPGVWALGQGKGFGLSHKAEAKKVELTYNGKLLTAYCYFDSTEKPVLFPIKTLNGTTITRGWPIAPRPGERTDHPHHVGLWLNYESVNGLDFWNNSYAIAPEKKDQYGSIRHQAIVSSKASGDKATLVTSSHWVDSKGKVLLEEQTTYRFSVQANNFIIDRITSLTAKTDVSFRDVKDGMLGLRVARELEMPSTQQDQFVDAKGNVTTVAAVNNVGVTGKYMNRDNVQGDACWGKRSLWTLLTGKKNKEDITIAIIDHIDNVGYPTYWHARGYGLFAANPLGQEVFSNGKEKLDFKLMTDQSVTFKHRVVVRSGKPDIGEIDRLMLEFNKRTEN